MIQKQKDLLFKDLCARLPYGIKAEIKYYDNAWKLQSIYTNGTTYATRDIGYPIETYFEDCKPYLFPLSSMTEEQKEEYCQLQQKIIYNSKGIVNVDVMNYINWCYKNHIDINGLIPMGLANDATGLNIY